MKEFVVENFWRIPAYIGLFIIAVSLSRTFDNIKKYPIKVKGECIDLLDKHKGERTYKVPLWKYSYGGKEIIERERNKSSFGNPHIGKTATLRRSIDETKEIIYVNRYKKKYWIMRIVGFLILIFSLFQFIK